AHRLRLLPWLVGEFPDTVFHRVFPRRLRMSDLKGQKKAAKLKPFPDQPIRKDGPWGRPVWHGVDSWSAKPMPLPASSKGPIAPPREFRGRTKRIDGYPGSPSWPTPERTRKQEVTPGKPR